MDILDDKDDPVPEPSQLQILQDLTRALQDSRGRTEIQLANLERKIDDVRPQIDQLRRELNTSQQDLRRELQNLFVTRAEYDPRHKILEDRMNLLDKILIEQNQAAIERAKLQQQLIQQDKDYDLLSASVDRIEERQRNALSRAVPWVATVIAVLSGMLNLLQHIQLK